MTHSLFTRLTIFVVALLGVGSAYAVGAGAVALMPQQHSLTHSNSIQNVPLTAKAALLYDIRSGVVLYQKNANEELPLASLTKLMAAFATLASRDGTTVVEVTEESIKVEGDSGLRAGDAYTLNDLLRLALVASSNDAAAAAAAALGPDYLLAMNMAAQEMGLTKTRFLNPTGLDVDAQLSGAYGSAYDVARLAAAFYLAHPALFEATVEARVNVSGGTGALAAVATAAPLHDIPGLIGGKTGFTDLAGGNLVMIFDLEVGRPVAAVVLGSTREGRFSDIRALITAARTSL